MRVAKEFIVGRFYKETFNNSPYNRYWMKLIDYHKWNSSYKVYFRVKTATYSWIANPEDFYEKDPLSVIDEIEEMLDD